MATTAFYDGRKSGQLGAQQDQNPYPLADPRCEEWNQGFQEGLFLRRASDVELFRALKRLRGVMAGLERLPAGYPEFWL